MKRKKCLEKMFLSFLCLLLLGNLGQIGWGQETDSDNNTDADIVRHYILLLDATAPFRMAIGNSNYFSYIREMLEREPSEVRDHYLPYRANRDIVSIAFFHFPVNPGSHKIIAKGLYTSKNLALIQGDILARQNSIVNFIENRLDDFRELAVSPIGLSEVTVFPFINRYIRDNRITIDIRVEKLYLVSLSDQKYNVEEAGLRSALESFAFAYHKRYYSSMRDYMKENFNDLLLLRNIEKPIRPASGNIRRVYFHYYEIKPAVEDIELKLTNKVALDRIAQKSADAGEPTMSWKGYNDVCLDNPTEHPAWVEWALPPVEEGQWTWHRCDSEPENENQENQLNVISAGCRPLCTDESEITKPVVQILKKDTLWSIQEEVTRFKEKIWYRGVIDIDIKDERYAYPFDFRYYLTPQKVEYVSNEVTEIGGSSVPYYYEYNVGWLSPGNLLGFFTSNIDKTEITDEIIKEKLNDKAFCSLVRKYANRGELSERFNSKTITELPAKVLAEASKIRARDTENWARWITLIAYFLVGGAIFFVYRYIIRKIEIRFNIDAVSKDSNSIVLDFSNPQRKKEVLAILELENMIKTFHPWRKNPKIELSFDMDYEFSGADRVIYQPENLLSIIDKAGREYKLKTGDPFYTILPDVQFNRKFEIVLNLSEIEDIETDNIGDKIIPFSFSLTSPEARVSRGGKLNISRMKTGAKENPGKRWDYSVNLLFKPESRDKEISIRPVSGEITETTENYVLDYTSKRKWVKLFDIEIKNHNTHHFSHPVDGMFSFKVNDSSSNPVPDVFYLSEKEISSTHKGEFSREKHVHLKKSDGQKNLNLYIKFDEFPNPVDHCDYTINSYFDNHIKKTLITRIHRSKEETEALVQLIDEGQVLPLDEVDYDHITRDNSLLVDKDTKGPIHVNLKIPVNQRKSIKEYGDTKLFILRLTNKCNTKTGFYQWKIKNIEVKGNSKIEFQDKRSVIRLIPNQYSGTIKDDWDIEEEIEFYLDHKKVKKFHSYHFTFLLNFSLIIEIFPKGEGEKASAPVEKTKAKPKQKQFDFSISFICYHDVKENYLVIDFGTSAICAYYHHQFPGTPGDSCYRIPLQSPANQMKSEYDLLPSIINLKNTKSGGETIREEGDDPANLAIAGSEHFVDLPARKDIFGLCPQSVLGSIKLLIVQGRKIVPIPEQIAFGFGKRYFVYLDEEGNTKKGNPSLSSVLKSCYEHLLRNYIEKIEEKRYTKVVLTYPNVYNRSHISFLKDEVFKDVFEETGRVYSENISMESESNCVLYYYLSKREEENVPDNENLLIVDIGAGTLDISLARVTWKEEMGVITPIDVEVVKRDGIAMAGDSLDKAIALQVHDLLKRFNEFDDFNYANKIASNEDVKLESKMMLILKQVMFNFKIEHILDFKKNISSRTEDDIVEICLGGNTEEKGLCKVTKESYEITIEEKSDSNSVTARVINKIGRLYLGMKKKEWLSLPYLKRFRQLLINKLEAFSSELEIPGNLSIVLSGRTSLWPAVPEAVRHVFRGEDRKIADIWSGDAREKAIELKRAVILGAILKTTTWKEVGFKEVLISGVEAIRFQKGRDSFDPDSWEIETFKDNPQLDINLANSNYFELGIKTSMDFVPFVGADGYKRDEYCNDDKKITVTLEKKDRGSGYDFRVISDKYRRGKGTRLRHVLSHETAFLKTKATYWPVREVQLRDISPQQFNENV